MQSYRGRPVLTWWRGRAIRGVGDGYYLIYDTSYRPIATVRAGNGLAGDIHEFLITSRNTALFTVYHQIPQDLSSVGGPKQGRIFDGIVQEVDIASGKVLLEWHSFPAIGLRESYAPPPKASRGAKAAPYDYFHANSIDVDKDGNLLVSGRNTDAVYKIRRSDGKLLWRLGGKQSDFKMGPGARFAWQHDARRRPDGTITLFDNGALPKVRDHSRALVLRLDSKARTATLVRSYSHPKKLSSGFEGNVQLLPNGNVFVGWGQHPYFTEYSRSGKVLFDVQFLKTADSYRAYRFVWTGRPTDRPTLAVRASTNGQTKVFASWNGATEVARWQVLAGPDPGHLKAIVARPKAGFETAIPFLTSEPYSAAYAFVAVRALDQNGRTLATSKTIPRRT